MKGVSESGPEEDAMPTGSMPAPESQGRAVVSQPPVEVTTRRPSSKNVDIGYDFSPAPAGLF